MHRVYKRYVNAAYINVSSFHSVTRTLELELIIICEMSRYQNSRHVVTSHGQVFALGVGVGVGVDVGIGVGVGVDVGVWCLVLVLVLAFGVCWCWCWFWGLVCVLAFGVGVDVDVCVWCCCWRLLMRAFLFRTWIK